MFFPCPIGVNAGARDDVVRLDPSALSIRWLMEKMFSPLRMSRKLERRLSVILLRGKIAAPVLFLGHDPFHYGILLNRCRALAHDARPVSSRSELLKLARPGHRRHRAPRSVDRYLTDIAS